MGANHVHCSGLWDLDDDLTDSPTGLQSLVRLDNLVEGEPRAYTVAHLTRA